MTNPQSHLRSVDPPDGGEPKEPARQQQRQRASRALPTDRMKLDVQLQVLHAIGRLSGAGKRPVTGEELGRAVNGLAPATVILSNRFFADAGWIENHRGQYTATDSLVEYTQRRSLAGSGPVPDEALELLRKPVRDQSWFWDALHPYLASGPLPFTEVAIILMREAQASESHRPMITNVITWLEMIGMVRVENEQVSLVGHVATDASGPQDPADTSTSQSPVTPDAAPTGTTGEKPTTHAGGHTPPYVIAFNYGIRMTAEDLARLSPEQIKAFFEAIGTVMALSKDG